MTIIAADLAGALGELGLGETGLGDRPVMVHASPRSFGEPVEGGADGLRDALLASGRSGRTVLVPAFSELRFEVTPPAAMRVARHGVDCADWPDRPDQSGRKCPCTPETRRS